MTHLTFENIRRYLVSVFNLKKKKKAHTLSALLIRRRGYLDIQFHREQYPGSESMARKEEEVMPGFQSNASQIKISPSLGNSVVTRLKCSPH